MEIKKLTPTWLLICDSKINSQSFGNYSSGTYKDFELEWVKKNGKNQNISQSEKVLELLAYDFLGIKNDKNLPNDKFLELYAKQLEPLYEHFNSTIVFNNVSHIFVKNMLLQRLKNFHINQKRLVDLSISLPSAFQVPNLQNIYGSLVGKIYDSIEEFVSVAKETGVSEKEALSVAQTMMPVCQQSQAIVTSSFSSWRTLIMNLTDFDCDEETRYIMIHLLRDLKIRYLGFFADLVFERQQDKKQFGSDSLITDGFWKTVKVNKRI